MSKLLEQIKKNKETKRLGDLVVINQSSITKDFPHKVIEYIDTSSVTRNSFDKPEILNINEAPSRAKRLVKDGDTILSTVRPSQHHYGFIRAPKPNTIVSTGFAVLTPQNDIDPFYLYSYLTQDSVTSILNAIAEATTTTFPAFRPEVLSDMEIEIPDLPTQKKIAEILGAYDAKIENNNQIIKNLELTAQTIFDEWFVKFRFPGHGKVKMVESEMGEIPEGWEVKKVSDVAHLNKGVSYTSAEINTEHKGAALINLGNFLRGGGFNSDGIKYYTGEYKSTHIVKPGQILIAMTDLTSNREVIGHPARLPENFKEAVISLDVCSLSPGKDIYLEFIYNSMLKRSFSKLMASCASGTNVSHLKKENIEGYDLIFPEESLLVQFNNFTQPVFTKQAILEEENQRLKQSRDQLLAKLI